MPTEVAAIKREHLEALLEDQLARWKPATAARPSSAQSSKPRPPRSVALSSRLTGIPRAAGRRSWASCWRCSRPRPGGWFVGQPSYHHERNEWLIYAFDPSERPVVGKRSREWTAIAPTEADVVREMACCLREIGEGRAPS
jgi:hypothetical protein